MLRTRIIPALLLKDDALVKTVKFKQPKYIGDPVNTVRIFNELEVDELVFLDIECTPQKRSVNLKVLSEIANECFMPLAYGGGISTLDQAKAIFNVGFEKVVINSAAHTNPGVISEIATHFGSQSVVASIDVKKNLWGKYEVRYASARKKTGRHPVEWAQELESRGCGEIILTSVDKEGTWSGFDTELCKMVNEAVEIPVIAQGGAGNIEDIVHVIQHSGVSAVALGSMVVYQHQGMGVLVNFPDEVKLKTTLG